MGSIVNLSIELLSKSVSVAIAVIPVLSIRHTAYIDKNNKINQTFLSLLTDCGMCTIIRTKA